MLLIKYGAKIDVVDSDGRDAIIYSVINNNEYLLRLLLTNKVVT
jgi:ankyrin repeat protein